MEDAGPVGAFGFYARIERLEMTMNQMLILPIYVLQAGLNAVAFFMIYCFVPESKHRTSPPEYPLTALT